ncbi:MAG: DUF6781 family protein [Burkholderiales bacterium]
MAGNPDSASIRDAAAETVRQGADIRDRVHELTLAALRRQRFDPRGVREVVRAVTEGIATGADKSSGDLRRALAEALRGLDQALRTSAEAGDVALRQLARSGRDFSDTEFKQALANLRKLEDDFLKTAELVAEGASARVQPELREALRNARRTGTETGKQVALTMGELAQKFSAASLDAALAGLEAASQVGQRFALVASGVLGAFADALRAPPPAPQEQPVQEPPQPAQEPPKPA